MAKKIKPCPCGIGPATHAHNRPEPHKPTRCANCGRWHWIHALKQLQNVERLGERLDIGGVVPAGECPNCGAFAYIQK